MDAQVFTTYLDLLQEVSKQIQQLTGYNQQKTEAVLKDDLKQLEQVVKKEQALSLALRGQEQKRQKLAQQLGFGEAPLSQLESHAPEELRSRARQVSEELVRQYQAYQASAEVARNTLECNLHEIEKVLEQAGAAPLQGAQGYEPPEVDLPPQMKTDFRA